MKEQDTQAALDAFPDGMNYQGQYVWDWFTKNSTTIRAALTAQLTKTPENVTCGDVSNSGDVQAALNSLFRLENDALSSRDGYGYSSGDAEIIRRVIMQYAELKENALTAQDVNAEKYDALFGTIESQKQTHDALIRMNRELLEALKECLPRIEEIRLVDLGAVRDAEMQDYNERKIITRRELAETNELVNKINVAIARAEAQKVGE